MDECLPLKREFKSLEHKKGGRGGKGAVTPLLGSLVKHIGRRITGLAGYQSNFRFSREILSALHTEWVHTPQIHIYSIHIHTHTYMYTQKYVHKRHERNQIIQF